jgi:SanA protein
LKNELNQNEVVLVTQAFHLPRALYLCNRVGLDARGVESDLRSYHKIVWFTFRDWLASLLAFVDVEFKRLPTYLEK